MKSIYPAVAAVICLGITQAEAQSPLTLESKIALGEVRGRIDHLAFDLMRRRLFVAELENDTVGIVDVGTGRLLRNITDLKGPQGLGYLRSTDTLFVANGGDGSLRMFEGAEYREVGRIQLKEDADNIRIDPTTNQVFVSHGDGAIAIIDASSRRKISDIELSAHPESFQLDKRTNRIYANDPSGQAVVVIDRNIGKPIAAWKTGNGSNFPMALDEASDAVLVVFRSPAKLTAFSALTGSIVTTVDTCRDADDMFVDAQRKRVYVSCGQGVVDVFSTAGGAYKHLGAVETSEGARTSLYVPEIDRLFVAARATAQAPAAIHVYRPQP